MPYIASKHCARRIAVLSGRGALSWSCTFVSVAAAPLYFFLHLSPSEKLKCPRTTGGGSTFTSTFTSTSTSTSAFPSRPLPPAPAFIRWSGSSGDEKVRRLDPSCASSAVLSTVPSARRGDSTSRASDDLGRFDRTVARASPLMSESGSPRTGGMPGGCMLAASSPHGDDRLWRCRE
eukprot:1195842-Prorocentrum_minimum.AAC.2